MKEIKGYAPNFSGFYESIWFNSNDYSRIEDTINQDRVDNGKEPLAFNNINTNVYTYED